MSKPFMRKLNPFKPTDIGGCVLWLDGADSSSIILATGSNVSTWIDKSSLANNFTNTNTTSPTKTTTPGGYPCVYLNGSTCQMTSVSNNSTTGNSSRTVIMISQTGAGGDSRFGTGPHGGASPPNTYGIDLAPIANIIFCPYVYTGSDVTAYGVPNTNMYSLYSYYNSSTSTVGGIVNFTLTASNSTTLNTSATPWYLGLRPDGGYSTAAYVCEIIQYNVILTTPQRQQLEGYLAQKWGLQANLPAGSPGRTGVIYPRTLLIDSLTTGQPTRLPFFRPLRVSVITPGSVFHLDAGNPASYPGSGSTWTDLAGSGLTTTLFGSPTYSSANGGYLSFAPASSQYGQTSASLTALTRWTVEIWHYYSATNGSGNPCILSEVWNSTPINFTIGSAAFGGNTTLQAAYFNSVWYYTASNYSLPSVGWYQIVGTYDGTNIKLYINNVLTQTQASAGTPASSGLGIRLMRRWDLGDYWGGRLAIVRIYNRALLASEVTTNYAANKARFGLS